MEMKEGLSRVMVTNLCKNQFINMIYFEQQETKYFFSLHFRHFNKNNAETFW